MAKKEKVIPRDIEDEMKQSYIDYAMSVIVGRALPDLRDGLKPVHRRILYAMRELGLVHNKPHKKSARCVGEVLGKYHPHGDLAVYDALVRMAQDFSLRYPLIDGQGNFGSVDGDAPAAMRYTEVRLARITEELLSDLDKNTVDFVDNFDGSLKEPSLLPARLPNLLINGSEGIAVGMATNIPPHNLGEVIDGINLLIDKPDTTIEELHQIIKGPDFPTAGIIYGKEGLQNIYATGRGLIKLRARVAVEDMEHGRQRIIVREIPYQVNKAKLLADTANLVKEKRIDGISDLRDESDREGIRVVIELKRDENPDLVLNQLFSKTQLQITYGAIMLALVDNHPQVLNLRQILGNYVQHRKSIVIRRTQFDLNKAQNRAHILEGLKIALQHLDAVIKIIKSSKDVDKARNSLMGKFKLSKMQAQAILDMKLQQLTGLERKKIDDEYLELIKHIAQLKAILQDPKKVLSVIKQELNEIKAKYADARKTEIVEETEEVKVEDLIKEEEVVITFSQAGYIKRIPLERYRSQLRGGRGITGMTMREEDFAKDIFITSTHKYMLFFSNLGKVYWLKVFQIPEASRQSMGKAIVNLLQMSSAEEKITAAVAVDEFTPDEYIVMATQSGMIKKTPLSAFSNPRRGGIIAVSLKQKDHLIEVKLTDGKQDIILGTREGFAIHFKEEDIRSIGRTGQGVRGIRLRPGDRVVGMEAVGEDGCFLVVTEGGFGKRTEVKKYRRQSRGGKGIINIKTDARRGIVVGMEKVNDEDEIVLMTRQGIINRQSGKGIRLIGRNTKGVRLIKLDGEDKVVGAECISAEILSQS